MNRHEFESWGQIRQSGQSKFLFRQGFMIYGLPFAGAIVSLKIGYLLFAKKLETSNISMSFIGENLFLFAVLVSIGIILARNIWQRKETEFETYKSEENG